jgi:Ca-activated chloride channel family protein
LGTEDRFRLLVFDDQLDWYQQGRLCPSADAEAAAQWLSTIEARGGTELATALDHLLGIALPEDRLTYVVIITDGQVGDEDRIYRMVQERGTALRFFTLGIDTAVNDPFLRRLAQLGRALANWWCRANP